MVVGVVEVTALRIACIAVLLLLHLLPPWWTSLDTCDTSVLTGLQVIVTIYIRYKVQTFIIYIIYIQPVL